MKWVADMTISWFLVITGAIGVLLSGQTVHSLLGPESSFIHAFTSAGCKAVWVSNYSELSQGCWIGGFIIVCLFVYFSGVHLLIRTRRNA
jgi:hypothetical protein